MPSAESVPSPTLLPLRERVLAYTGCFFSRIQTIKEIHEYLSRGCRIKEEDMRLWLYNSEDDVQYITSKIQIMNYLTLLWTDEDHTHLEYLEHTGDEQIFGSIEVELQSQPPMAESTELSEQDAECGPLLIWEESKQRYETGQKEMSFIANSSKIRSRHKGTNPIGMKGHMAKCYGDLIQELWSGTQKNIAPLKLRWTIAKYAPRFNGFQQQDSQELLAFLLDGLHEDLNRVHDKPYVELKDSDGRPDWEVAAEAWENHLRRNRSIVVDLFHGQLRSQVKIRTQGTLPRRAL
uniref:Ubiquitin carboxyl-terminal hydrolase 32 n=1 Tax=Sphaerodactylus townsendi TaxID=933632 RepID=A0ACB8ECH0_9SAUR